MHLQAPALIAAIAFFLTTLAAPFLIPLLRRLKFGQSIREDGPSSHMKKTGTPTMGGLIFGLAIFVALVLYGFLGGAWTPRLLLLLGVFFGFGLLGFADDFIKVVLKRNLGLTSLQKLIGQVLIAGAAYWVLFTNGFPMALNLFGHTWHLGIFYALFVVFWLVGFSNAVNLTDGLDGLVASTASIAFLAFAFLAARAQQFDVAIFCAAVLGGLLGFFLFNKNPAKIFMGDTGSLALGGALAMVSIVLHLEWLLLVIGIVFVAETLSVILQVISFRTTGKRLFKMSPIHHHFELSGWSEWKVVFAFSTAGLLAAVIAVMWEGLS